MKSSIKIILMTHGDWGKELIRCAKMIIGHISNCTAIGLFPENALKDYRNLLEKELDGAEEVLLLADMKGGSPANLASVYAKNKKSIYALCGLGLEMLLSAESLREIYSGDKLTDEILKEVKEKCMNLKE